jgi:hypothetical protein
MAGLGMFFYLFLSFYLFLFPVCRFCPLFEAHVSSTPPPKEHRAHRTGSVNQPATNLEAFSKDLAWLSLSRLSLVLKFPYIDSINVHFGSSLTATSRFDDDKQALESRESREGLPKSKANGRIWEDQGIHIWGSPAFLCIQSVRRICSIRSTHSEPNTKTRAPG